MEINDRDSLEREREREVQHLAPADDVSKMVTFSKELLDHMDLKF